MPNSNGKKQLTQVREWEDVVLACRDYGHAWQPADVWSSEDHDRLRVRESTCARCGTIRSEGIERRSGEMAFRRYHDRPLGYLAKPGLGHIPVARLRVEVLRRAGV